MHALHQRRIEADDLAIHAIEAGYGNEPAVLFLHGWPESSAAFAKVMTALRHDLHTIAIDLPGIGESRTPAPSNDKRTLARYVRAVIEHLQLKRVVLVGHDVGGQIVYAFLREFDDVLEGAVIMNVAVPGVDPWDEVKRNPHIWHFTFHAVPELPETLVAGRQAAYFDYFYDTISATPQGVGKDARATYATAYARPEALHAGFEWYRAFAQDEKDNARTKSIDTRVLYLRGEKEQGLPLKRYVEGLREKGVRNIEGHVIPGSGHFAPDEQPEAVARALRAFVTARATENTT